MNVMPSYSICLSAETIAAYKADDEDALSLIISDVQDDEETLSRLLDHYCKDERGGVDSSSVMIDSKMSSLDKGLSGHLMINFQEDAYYGCRDMDVHDDHVCEVPFTVDIAAKTITFSAPESSRPSYYHDNE